jgi:anaerobic selenocysteine-containing dehydrogenase
MCVKGLSSIEHLYNPLRLRHPLRRTGKRGEGKWKTISWDEALETIVHKIREIIQSFGPESIAIGTGTGRHHFMHVLRFANALGTPNWCEPGTAQCFIPRILTGMMTYGDLPICDYYGDVNPGCVLVWGHNPVISGPDGEIQFRVRECLKKGAKLIVVDPRQTELARKADIWLQVRPGTDDALALSMLNIIIREEIHDRAFVERWTSGFEKLARRVEAFPPEWAEQITWVPADKIRAAARLFAQTRPAALEWGVALEQTPNCLQTVRAVALLPAVTGNIDVPGGWILGMHAVGDPPLLAENIPADRAGRRMGADRFKVLCGAQALFPSAHIPTLFHAIRTGEPYPIRAFLVFGNNALVTYGNSRRVHETLMSVDFLSVMDIYMTPTAELADIVLPAATWLEVDQVVTVPFVANNVALVQQKLTRVGESRPDEEVFVDIALRLGLSTGTVPLREVYDRQLDPLGITFDQLREKGFATVPLQYRKHEERGFFLTPSGKVELYSQYLESLGYDPLPHYEEPPESPVSRPDLAELYPLILTTGGRIQQFFCSEHRQIPSLRTKYPDPLVEIHPDTAARLGIREGDWVWIETVRGRIRQRARLTQIHPRVINVQYGWWFPEEGGPEYGVWRSNANVLTSTDPPYDPALGTYQLRALLCKAYKDEENAPMSSEWSGFLT